ncbi:hypothetical protein BLOT_014690, partial [Blomia tropicalis]
MNKGQINDIELKYGYRTKEKNERNQCKSVHYMETKHFTFNWIQFSICNIETDFYLYFCINLTVKKAKNIYGTLLLNKHQSTIFHIVHKKNKLIFFYYNNNCFIFIYIVYLYSFYSISIFNVLNNEIKVYDSLYVNLEFAKI